MQKKLNGVTSRYWDTVYLNIRKETIDKLEYNFQWSVTIKILNNWAMFSFPSKPREDLLTNIELW